MHLQDVVSYPQALPMSKLHGADADGLFGPESLILNLYRCSHMVHKPNTKRNSKLPRD